MAGKKGMKQRSSASFIRRKAWQSMRIMRRFTAVDISRTSGAKRENVLKYLRGLNRHGYVEPLGKFVGGRPGVFKAWRLVRDTGPIHPIRCDRCGNTLTKPCKPEGESHGDQG